jgi:hypothetical protein
VYEHIARHMLHPKVRLAVTLRQLLDFLSLLQTSLVINEDGGACAVDKGNAELYLKVIAQVLTLYKVDTTGMLFTEEEKGGGPRGGGVAVGRRPHYRLRGGCPRTACPPANRQAPECRRGRRTPSQSAAL